MRRRLGLAALLLLGAAAAPQPGRPEADRPLLLPARDVDVTYAVAAANRMLHQRMRWDVAGRRLRVDPPVTGLYMILDYAEGRLSVVRTEDRSVMPLPANPGMLPGAGAASFARLGEAGIAGLACTEWRTTDTAGQEAELCLTADGVLLRARSGAQVLLQASRVDYAPQPAELFQPPPGYTLLTPAAPPASPTAPAPQSAPAPQPAP